MARAVVAEDEDLLREELLAQLRRAWPELEIVAACEDGGSALEAIAPERLDATVKRLRTRLASNESESSELASIIDQLRSRLPASTKGTPLQWITASAGKETRLIMVDDIAYFQADNKYTVVMTAEGEALIRKPIRELLDGLDPNVFKQIHRSTIVNMKAIAGITRDESGRGTIRLKKRPETLPVSLTYMPLFRNM